MPTHLPFIKLPHKSTVISIGANALVYVASKLALSLNISPLVVGLAVVAFATSAPEMAVLTGAVINGQSDIAIGNVLFILRLSALVAPLIVYVVFLLRQSRQAPAD